MKIRLALIVLVVLIVINQVFYCTAGQPGRLQNEYWKTGKLYRFQDRYSRGAKEDMDPKKTDDQVKEAHSQNLHRVSHPWYNKLYATAFNLFTFGKCIKILNKCLVPQHKCCEGLYCQPKDDKWKDVTGSCTQCKKKNEKCNAHEMCCNKRCVNQGKGTHACGDSKSAHNVKEEHNKKIVKKLNEKDVPKETKVKGNLKKNDTSEEKKVEDKSKKKDVLKDDKAREKLEKKENKPAKKRNKPKTSPDENDDTGMNKSKESKNSSKNAKRKKAMKLTAGTRKGSTVTKKKDKSFKMKGKQKPVQSQNLKTGKRKKCNSKKCKKSKKNSWWRTGSGGTNGASTKTRTFKGPSKGVAKKTKGHSNSKGIAKKTKGHSNSKDGAKKTKSTKKTGKTAVAGKSSKTKDKVVKKKKTGASKTSAV